MKKLLFALVAMGFAVCAQAATINTGTLAVPAWTAVTGA